MTTTINFMKILKKKIFFIYLVILLGITNILNSQTTLALKFSPIGIHPFNEKNSHIYENKIDANGIFVTEPGLIFGVETFLREDYFSFRAMAGILSDAASKPAFFLHVGLKQRLFQVWRHSLAIGAGGNLYGREGWSTILGYEKENGWGVNGTWEYKVGIMAELEYIFFLGERHDILVSLLYGHQPRTFSFTIGYRFWLSTEIKHPKDCGSCPFQQKGKKKKIKWHK